MTTRTTEPSAPTENYILRLPGAERRTALSSLLELLLPLLLLISAIPYALGHNSMFGIRCLMAGAVFILLFTLRRSRAMPILALIYLSTLGGVRRNLIPIMGDFHVDPLLTVVPLVVVLICLGKLLRLQIPLDNPIAKARAALLLVMLTIGLLNPLQGSPLVALGGVMFLVVPVLWSLIGRDLGDKTTLRQLYLTALLLAAMGAFYGIYQTLYGFTKGEMMWFASAPQYTSAHSYGAIRPMSFFTSQSEYAPYLAMALVIGVAFALFGEIWTLIVVVLLAAGILYSGARGPLVGSIVGMVVLWAVRGRSPKLWVPRLFLALCISVAGLYYGIQHAEEVTISPAQQGLVYHQIEGITHPTDPNHSTAGIHAAAAFYGITASLAHPFGIGLGNVTLAGYQFGSGSHNLEVDWSNMFEAMGPIGGILYIFFILTTLRCAFQVWHRSRSMVCLAILGVLCTLINGWLNAGNYAILMLLWFSIGALEREYVMLHAQTSTSPVSAARTGMAASSGT